jgi:DNA-binding SARP family transcriptional activator
MYYTDRDSHLPLESGQLTGQLTLMRRFDLRYEGRTITVPPRVQRVLAFLGLRGCGNRTDMAGELWPESSDAKAHASLRTALWRARQIADGLIIIAGDSLTITPRVQVDVPNLVAQARSYLASGGSIDGWRGRPVPVSWGDLLPGWYEDWVLIEREQIRQLHLHLLEDLARLLTERGRFAEAIDAALEAVRLEPLRGSSNRALIAAHLAEGNLHEANRHYLSFRQLLRTELGVEPPSEVTDLISGRPAAPRAGNRTVTLEFPRVAITGT